MNNKKIKTSHERFTPYGGHLIDPPENCEYKRKAFDGGIWTDLGYCQRNSCANTCEEYKWFKKASQLDRIQREINHGVDIRVSCFPDIGLTEPEKPEEEKPKKRRRRRRK